MVLYFLRHADAEPGIDNDFDRKLTAKGLTQAEKVGKFMLRAELCPEIILSSPVVRAHQTARSISQRFGKIDLLEVPWLACGMSPESCLKELAAYAHLDSILLVGHEPDFGEVIATLLDLPVHALKIRKASLTAIDLHELKPGAGQLQFQIPSRLM